MVELHRLERIVIYALKGGKKKSLEEVQKMANIPAASISRAALWLSSKGYIKVEKVEKTIIQLGPEGRRFMNEGIPERLLVEAIIEEGGNILLNEAQALTGMEKGELNIAVGWARRKGWLLIDTGSEGTALSVPSKPIAGSDERLISLLSEGPIDSATLTPELSKGLTALGRRPDVVILKEEVGNFLKLTEEGLRIAAKLKYEAEKVSQLTPEMIKSGRWRHVHLRKYDIKAPVARISIGKKQPYLRFLDDLRWKLVSLGFKEMKGPIVEFMFFNCDALYMPQDHPAREIHDIYYIKSPTKGNLSQYNDLVKNVKETHENGWITNSLGWGYNFSTTETRRLVLRSQGTCLSARMLVDKNLEIPGKYFSIARCYRPDVVNKTHLTEFNHVEGIVVGDALTFRDLLGVLKMFTEEVAGADRFKFRPDYFPFTEPSVELSAFKEGFGWLEFGGAGMFRPEVTIPLGIKVPVIAWGLGVDRLFMMRNGIDDIRDLFSQNLNWLRTQSVI